MPEDIYRPKNFTLAGKVTKRAVPRTYPEVKMNAYVVLTE
jgi:hypothetical protein